MRKHMVVWTLCFFLMLFSFFVLLAEDRHLGVPLPFSLPLAFVAMLLLAGISLVLAEWLRVRHPVVRVKLVKPSVTASRRQHHRPGMVEGFVLLEFPDARNAGRNAA